MSINLVFKVYRDHKEYQVSEEAPGPLVQQELLV
jgi:hypothetical protein